MSGFLGVPVGAAYHLVFALTHLLTPVAGSVAAVAAIVLFTAAVRLLISPLSLRALRGQAVTARLAPQVQSLRARHRRQPERLQRELTALYKREGASPFSGLLPVLAQWPFLSVMYLLFRSAAVDGGPNQLLSGRLLGVPLGAHWLSGAGLLSVHGTVFLAALAVLAGLCWLSARLAQPAAPVAAARPSSREAAKAAYRATGGASGGPSSSEAAAAATEAAPAARTAGALTQLLPYVTVVIAVFAPLAAVIYLLTTVAWTLGERSLFLRRAATASSGPVPGNG
jgi:YidC/Oxa1 family membrane protein insertase